MKFQCVFRQYHLYVCGIPSPSWHFQGLGGPLTRRWHVWTHGKDAVIMHYHVTPKRFIILQNHKSCLILRMNFAQFRDQVKSDGQTRGEWRRPIHQSEVISCTIFSSTGVWRIEQSRVGNQGSYSSPKKLSFSRFETKLIFWSGLVFPDSWRRELRLTLLEIINYLYGHQKQILLL